MKCSCEVGLDRIGQLSEVGLDLEDVASHVVEHVEEGTQLGELLLPLTLQLAVEELGQIGEDGSDQPV